MKEEPSEERIPKFPDRIFFGILEGDCVAYGLSR
jgi:hypothetical protein